MRNVWIVDERKGGFFFCGERGDGYGADDMVKLDVPSSPSLLLLLFSFGQGVCVVGGGETREARRTP